MYKYLYIYLFLIQNPVSWDHMIIAKNVSNDVRVSSSIPHWANHAKNVQSAPASLRQASDKSVHLRKSLSE